MRNCAKTITSVFLVVMFFLAINVSALTYEVGVKVGDWAKYEYIFKFESFPSKPLPPEFEEAEQISHSLIEVKEVFDTTSLKLQETIFYKNGSQKTNILIGDIETGGGNLSVQLIARNLGERDKISKASDAPIINRTVLMSYAWATRKVNRVFIIDSSPFSENYTALDFYWDKDTGILCEMIMSSDMSTEDSRIITIIQWIIIETNLWQIEASGLGWEAFIVFMIIVIGGALFIFRKSLRKRFSKRRLKYRYK